MVYDFFQAIHSKLPVLTQYIASWYFSLSFLGKIIFFEFIAIGFIVAVVLFYNKLKLRKLKKSFALKSEVNKLFIEAVNKKIFLSPDALKPEYKNLSLLVPVILNLNKRFEKNTHWLFILDHFLEYLLLPLARKDSQSPHWMVRHWALRCFMIDPRLKDEQYLLSFLVDPVAYNRFMSLKPLLKIGTEYSVQSMIDTMKQENRHSRNVYGELMKESSSDFVEFIRDRLIDEDDPEIRRVCIELLSDHINTSDVFLIKKDLSSKNKYLKLTSLRCLQKFEGYYASQLMLKYLNDPDWEVRSLTSKFVGDRNAIQAIPQLIKNMGDDNWWVRFNAAISLSKLGRPGLAALNSVCREQDPYAYQMSQYVKRLHYQADGQKMTPKMNFENLRKTDDEKIQDIRREFERHQKKKKGA